MFCRPAYLQGLRTCRCRRTSPLPLRWSYPRSPAWCVHTPPGMQRSKKQIPPKNKFHDIPNQKSRFHPIPSKVSPWLGGFPDHFGWLKSRISSRKSRCFPWKMNTQTTSGIWKFNHTCRGCRGFSHKKKTNEFKWNNKTNMLHLKFQILVKPCNWKPHKSRCQTTFIFLVRGCGGF